MPELLAAIGRRLDNGARRVIIHLPYDQGGLLDKLYQQAWRAGGHVGSPGKTESPISEKKGERTMDVMLRPWRPEDAPLSPGMPMTPRWPPTCGMCPCPYQLSDAEEFIRLCRAAEPEQAIFRAIVVDGQAVAAWPSPGARMSAAAGRPSWATGWAGPSGAGGHHDQGGGGDVPDGL